MKSFIRTHKNKNEKEKKVSLNIRLGEVDILTLSSQWMTNDE